MGTYLTISKIHGTMQQPIKKSFDFASYIYSQHNFSIVKTKGRSMADELRYVIAFQGADSVFSCAK